MTTTLDTALTFANLGWHVFPVQPPPNKRPVTEHGFLEATTDHAIISAWWSDWPSAQIGVACGPSGILPVDLDEKPKLWISGRASLDTIGVDVDTACNLVMGTPRNGGKQLFFAAKGVATRRQLDVLPGIDLLGDGGYTIVPSPASPGRTWLVGDPMEDDLDPIPPWLDKLRQPGRHSPGPASATVAVKEVPMDDAQHDEVWEALKFIPNDDRGDWIKVGMALKSTGAKEQAYQIWQDWSRGSPKYDAADQRYQWDRLHTLRMDGSEITLGTLFHMARAHGYGEPEIVIAPEPVVKAPYSAAVQMVIDKFGGTVIPPIDPSKRIDLRPKGAHDARRASSAPVSLDTHQELTGDSGLTPDSPGTDQIQLSDWQDVANLPMVRWLIRGLIPERSITLLAGDTMMGKSFAAIDIAMRLVHNREFFGRKVRPCSVLYLAGEGQQGLAARFRLWAKERTICDGEDEGRFCLVSNKIPELNARSVGTLRKMLTAIVKRKGHAPGLVVIDTLSQALDGDENDASVTSPVLRALAAIRDEFGCTILIVHHTIKIHRGFKDDEEKWIPLTLNQIRGSGAITRNVDTVLGLQVSKSNRSVFELLVLKQKDGTTGKPIRFTRHTYSTGRIDEDGVPETSCIIQPTTEERQKREADPEMLRVEKEDEGIRRLVIAIRREGAIGARDSVVKAAGIKLSLGRYYLDLAIQRKAIISVGSKKRGPKHVLPDHPDALGGIRLDGKTT